MRSGSILLQILGLILICALESNAQNSEVFFINNNNAPEAARLDLEIRVMPVDTVYIKLRRIRFLHASRSVSIPSSTLFKLRFVQSGTNKTFLTKDSIIYSPEEFTVLFLTGTASDRHLAELTARHQLLLSSKVRYNFRHSKLTLREIDLIAHLTEDLLEYDIGLRDKAFQYDDQIDNSDSYFDLGDR